MTHTVRATRALSGHYIAICSCGWCDFPRLTWTSAMRDVAYHREETDAQARQSPTSRTAAAG